MPESTRKAEYIGLATFLALAIVTRLGGLSWAPPLINQDEVSNGYDAYCLYKTGMDRWGARWPIILHAFGRGDNRPALYAYLTIPFIAALGIEEIAVATRLPAALGAVVTILCFYLLVRRTVDARTGSWAALLLTVSPWHLQLTRFGLECALTPVFTPVALLALSFAGWPLRGVNEQPRKSRLGWGWLMAFGAVVGLAPYAYASMRAFTPVMLLAGLLLYRRELWTYLRQPRSRLALLAGCFTFVAVIAPLAWFMLTHPGDFFSRARNVSVFHEGPPLPQAALLAAKQYLAHFGPNWLFREGDRSIIQSTPKVGNLHWCLIPFLVVGWVELLRGYRRNRLYLLILAWLLLHPVASAPTLGAPHALRAAVGIGAWEWTGAIGISVTIAFLSNRVRAPYWVPGFVGLAVAINAAWSLRQYFFVFARSPYVMGVYQSDLCEVARFLRPRWQDYDRIFISDHESAEHAWFSFQPYIYVLGFLPVEPEQFWAWEKDIYYKETDQNYHKVEAVGPFTFTARPEVLEQHFRGRGQEKVLIFGRPGDITGAAPIHVIRDPDGRPRFEVIEIAPLDR